MSAVVLLSQLVLTGLQSQFGGKKAKKEIFVIKVARDRVIFFSLSAIKKII